MKNRSRIVARCGLSAALALVLMALGSALGVMTYVCPILCGFLILLLREDLGTKWALTVWAAVGILGVMLVPETEMLALFVGVFGWYGAVQPGLDRLPRLLGWMIKLLLLNGTAAGVYLLLMQLMGVQDMPESLWGWLLFLFMGNVIFLCYDLLLRRLRVTLIPRLRRRFPG